MDKGIGIYKLAKENGFLKSSEHDLSLLEKKNCANVLVMFRNIKAANFNLSSFALTPLFTRYIRSLLAKPFVILSGNSGTGKTRIATRFAKDLEKKTDAGVKNHLLIPV